MNVRGFYDMVAEVETDGVFLYDIKTIGSYPWKIKFGKNAQAEPNNNHFLQLGTYGFLLEKERKLCDKVVYMANAYLDKNDGSMQIREAPSVFKDMAKAWWQKYLDLKELDHHI